MTAEEVIKGYVDAVNGTLHIILQGDDAGAGCCLTCENSKQQPTSRRQRAKLH